MGLGHHIHMFGRIERHIDACELSDVAGPSAGAKDGDVARDCTVIGDNGIDFPLLDAESRDSDPFEDLGAAATRTSNQGLCRYRSGSSSRLLE